jgi:methionyl-tRNA formyltransferase
VKVGYLGVASEIPGVLAAAGLATSSLSRPPSRDRARELDVLVVAGWGRRLERSCFAAPRFGTVNVHPSALPRRRGPEPLRWALLEGDERFGVTAHRMTDELDAGPILWQSSVPARPLDTYSTLLRDLLALAALALPGVLLALSRGVPGKAQDELASGGVATIAPRVPPALLRLDPALEPAAFCRRVAAASDRAPALEGPRGPVRFVQAAELEGPRASPGEVLGVEGRRVALAVGSGAVLAVSREPVALAPGERLVGGGLR